MDGGNVALSLCGLQPQRLLYYKRPDRNRQGDLFALEGLFDQFQTLVLRDRLMTGSMKRMEPYCSVPCFIPAVQGSVGSASTTWP